jgi:hypothetical protein
MSIAFTCVSSVRIAKTYANVVTSDVNNENKNIKGGD